MKLRPRHIVAVLATVTIACGGLATTGNGGTSGGGGTAGSGGAPGSGGAGQAGNSGSSGSGGFSVSAIYMAIDRGGAQHRDLFYTDSKSIYCDVLFSSGKQDATVDFTIFELAGPGGAAPLHNVFAGGTETVAGPGTEARAVFDIPPNGLEVTTNCTGRCAQNGAGCPRGYFDEGKDSAGPGATCCFNPTGQPASCSGVLPYPVGTFQCVVQIDGVRQSEAPTFQIDYPPPVTLPGGTVEICPATPPVSGIICAGWVPQGAKCEGFNAGETCVCKGASWECMKH